MLLEKKGDRGPALKELDENDCALDQNQLSSVFGLHAPKEAPVNKIPANAVW